MGELQQIWLGLTQYHYHILPASTDKILARGYVNTDYLLSLTEDDAEREQKLLYRFSNNYHNYLF